MMPFAHVLRRSDRILLVADLYTVDKPFPLLSSVWNSPGMLYVIAGSPCPPLGQNYLSIQTCDDRLPAVYFDRFSQSTVVPTELIHRITASEHCVHSAGQS